MDLHQNARLTWRSREALAKKIMIERLTLNAAVPRSTSAEEPSPSGSAATAPWVCTACGIVPRSRRRT
jgi:hypothetical protein